MCTRRYEIIASTCGYPVCPQWLAPNRKPATHARATSAASENCDQLPRPPAQADDGEASQCAHFQDLASARRCRVSLADFDVEERFRALVLLARDRLALAMSRKELRDRGDHTA
eukprot:7839384-Heterocapsa_arctica.AAC.1